MTLAKRLSRRVALLTALVAFTAVEGCERLSSVTTAPRRNAAVPPFAFHQLTDDELRLIMPQLMASASLPPERGGFPRSLLVTTGERSGGRVFADFDEPPEDWSPTTISTTPTTYAT